MTHLFGFAWMIDRQGVAELRELMRACRCSEGRICLQASKERPQPRAWVGGRYDSQGLYADIDAPFAWR